MAGLGTRCCQAVHTDSPAVGDSSRPGRSGYAAERDGDRLLFDSEDPGGPRAGGLSMCFGTKRQNFSGKCPRAARFFERGPAPGWVGGHPPLPPPPRGFKKKLGWGRTRGGSACGGGEGLACGTHGPCDAEFVTNAVIAGVGPSACSRQVCAHTVLHTDCCAHTDGQ